MSFPFSSRSGGQRRWRDAAHYCTVTIALIAVSILVAALSQLGDHPEKVDGLYFSSQQELREVIFTEEELANWESIPQAEILLRNAKIETILKHPARDIQKGQVWRAVTPMFLHFGILHIIFNMMWLWDFGRVLETRFGSLRFLALVLLTAALSNAAEALSGGTNFGGMSGVNYALFGFLLARSKLHPDPGFVLNSQTVATLLIWLVVCFTNAFGPVANTAHVVGFASGGLVGIVNALQGGAWALLKRKRQFRSALRKSDHALHQCATCSRTEHDDPDLEFYVHPNDGKEYCKDHLPV